MSYILLKAPPATISRVVVFPTLPVIPTNGIERRARRQRPDRLQCQFRIFHLDQRAVKALRCRLMLRSQCGCRPIVHRLNQNDARLISSPISGTNRSAPRILRESMLMCFNSVSASPQSSVPDTASTICLTVIWSIFCLQIDYICSFFTVSCTTSRSRK